MAAPAAAEEPKPQPWFAGSCCALPPLGKEGAHLARGFQEEQRGHPNIPSAQGASPPARLWRRHPGSPRAPRTEGQHPPPKGPDAVAALRWGMRLLSIVVVVPRPESERRPRQERSWGGPGVPELATDGWRQLADTCPSSPPRSCPSLSSPLVLFEFPALWVKPEGPTMLLLLAQGNLSQELDLRGGG